MMTRVNPIRSTPPPIIRTVLAPVSCGVRLRPQWSGGRFGLGRPRTSPHPARTPERPMTYNPPPNPYQAAPSAPPSSPGPYGQPYPPQPGYGYGTPMLVQPAVPSSGYAVW